MRRGYTIPSIRDWKSGEVDGKRILVRVDLNVPIVRGRVADDWRLRAVLPTIRFLTDRGARVILLAHLGRPNGRRVAALSLRLVAKRLSTLLGKPVSFVSEVIGPRVQKVIARSLPGEVLLLENLRFAPGEEKNGLTFARRLAALGDRFVQEGFAVCHRRDASLVRLPKLLPAAAGLLLIEEISALSHLLDRPKKPFVVLVGGAKIETKIGVIRALTEKAQTVAIGGALLVPFLKALGHAVGASRVAAHDVRLAKQLLTLHSLLLPTDVVVATSPKGKPMVRKISEIGEGEYVYDIGPATIRAYAKKIRSAQTVVWNGPMGYAEIPAFSHGSHALAWIIASRSRGKAYGVIGGGETIQIMKKREVIEWMDWVSTGGGAMLTFLEGKPLPGIVALQKR
jgi:phosphoglycerate kinase